MSAEALVAGADQAIVGMTPARTYRPESEAECAEVLAREAQIGGRVAFAGGRTAIELGGAPQALDAVVHTGGMGRILDYAPSDMVLAAEAGVTVAQLQEAARAERQMLALDPPLPERATVGGVVAAGTFGPRRTRYGGVRDLIIGVTLVRADGVVARGGGKVVKNVAGFDLPKLMVGSLGSLGLIASATFRLHPLPEASATVLLSGLAPDQVVSLLGRARQAQLEPAAVAALRAGSTHDLGVRFEGFGHGVRQQTARLVEIARAAQLPCEALADDAGFWARHDAARSAGPLRAKLCALPSQLPAVDGLIAPLMSALRGGSMVWYASLGIGFAGGEVADAGAASAALAAARAQLVAGGGSLVVECAPADVRAVIDPWGPVPDSFSLMVELKKRFDPQGRLNPSRSVGGL